MPDQLSIINDALILTGNHPYNEADDGSPEWNVCSAGYDRALNRLLDEHNWKFAKTVEAVDERTDPDDPAWADAYTKPDGCVHVVRVMDEDGGQLDEWKILGDKILVNKDDGITVEFIQDTDPSAWPGLFVDTVMQFVIANIYRGLNKDPTSARAEEDKGERLLRQARPRGDQEQPAGPRFISSLKAARSTRRG